MKNAGQLLFHPLGTRIYSPNDWIVRVARHDGGTELVGVPPEASEEEAVRAGVRHTMLRAHEIKQVDISRRRDYSKVQA